MRQISVTNVAVSLSTGTTQWANLFNGMTAIGSSADQGRMLWPHTGSLRAVRVELSAAPGAGKSWTFTIYVETVAVATIVIADTDTVGTFAGNIAITEGQRVETSTTPSGTPSGQPKFVTWEFDGDDDYTSGYGIDSFGIALNDREGLPFSGGPIGATTFADIVPLEGTVEAFYVHQDKGNGVNAGVCTYTWLKNGVAQDGTGGTVDTVLTVTTMADNQEVDVSKVINLPLAAGDRVRIEMHPVSGSDIRSGTVTARYRGGRPFRFIMAGNYSNVGTSDNFAPIRQQANLTSWLGTEVSDGAKARNASTTFTLGEAWMHLGTAPGAGKSRTTSMRVNAATSALAVTVSDTDQQGSNLVDTAFVDALAYTNVISGIANAPASSLIAFSMVALVATEIISSGSLVTEPVIRERISPHINQERKRITVRSFQLDGEQGVGLRTGQGEDPQLTLRVSRDGGRTWGTLKFGNVGAMGQYAYRTIWRQLGQARDWVFWVQMADPVKTAWTAAYLEAEEDRD